MKERGMKDKRIAFGIVIGLGLIADQITKELVVRRIELFDRIPVISGFFDLVHYRNTGVAFGLFRDGNTAYTIPFFVTTAILAVGFLLYFLSHDRSRGLLVPISLGLIGSGALGNVIDRIRHGNVVDFLLVYVRTWAWPAFNVADAAICVGAVLLVLDMFRQSDDGAESGASPKVG